MTYRQRYFARFTVKQVLITTPAPVCPKVPATTIEQRRAFARLVEAGLV